MRSFSHEPSHEDSEANLHHTCFVHDHAARLARSAMALVISLSNFSKLKKLNAETHNVHVYTITSTYIPNRGHRRPPGRVRLVASWPQFVDRCLGWCECSCNRGALKNAKHREKVDHPHTICGNEPHKIYLKKKVWNAHFSESSRDRRHATLIQHMSIAQWAKGLMRTVVHRWRA